MIEKPQFQCLILVFILFSPHSVSRVVQEALFITRHNTDEAQRTTALNKSLCVRLQQEAKATSEAV